METRKCGACEEEKPLTFEFFSRANKDSGNFLNVCRKCYNAHNRRRGGYREIPDFCECCSQKDAEVKLSYLVDKYLCKTCKRILDLEKWLRNGPWKGRCLKDPIDTFKCLKIRIRAHTLTEQTGNQHVVDHIISKKDGGCHVSWNLQAVTYQENLKKHEKSDPALVLTLCALEDPQLVVEVLRELAEEDQTIRLVLLKAGLLTGLLQVRERKLTPEEINELQLPPPGGLN